MFQCQCISHNSCLWNSAVVVVVVVVMFHISFVGEVVVHHDTEHDAASDGGVQLQEHAQSHPRLVWSR